jgi:hypothetical protein
VGNHSKPEFEQVELFPATSDMVDHKKGVQKARNKMYGKAEAKMKAIEAKRRRPTADGD